MNDMNQAAGSIAQFTPETQARFWAKVDKNGPVPDLKKYGDIGPCCQWTGCRLKGRNGESKYGLFQNGCKLVTAHRMSWTMHFGQIPIGAWVLHRCDNMGCVRASHLVLGDHKSNVADKVAKGRSPTGLKNGSHTHPEKRPRGEQNGCSVLTEDSVREIRRLRAEKVPYTKIATQFGISLGAICHIIKGRNWAHVV